jgi:hypothetical protein
MKTFILAKESLLKKCMFLVLLAMPVVLMSCVPGTAHMIDQDMKPKIATKPGKAVLVIVRGTSYGWAQVIDNYLDGKMIGQTQGNSYFITDVTPGSHYVMGHAENNSSAKIHFKAGRFYFLNQYLTPGFMTMRTGFAPMTAEEALKDINDEGCDYRVYNAQEPGEDMDPDDYQETKADFEKEAKDDPDRHKDMLEYKGYSKL